MLSVLIQTLSMMFCSFINDYYPNETIGVLFRESREELFELTVESRI